MPKIYQPKPDRWIPHNLYMQIIYIIRDYDRLKASQDDVILESPPPPDGMPKGNGTGDPTSSKAFKLAMEHDKVGGIEKAMKTIPPEYLHPILDNINNQTKLPDYADRKTWSRWKGTLIRRVGENLNML